VRLPVANNGLAQQRFRLRMQSTSTGDGLPCSVLVGGLTTVEVGTRAKWCFRMLASRSWGHEARHGPTIGPDALLPQPNTLRNRLSTHYVIPLGDIDLPEIGRLRKSPAHPPETCAPEGVMLVVRPPLTTSTTIPLHKQSLIRSRAGFDP